MAKRKKAWEFSSKPEGSSGLSKRERREREDSERCLCGRRKQLEYLNCYQCSMFSRWLMENWEFDDIHDSADDAL